MFINHNFEIWHKNAYRLSCTLILRELQKTLIISRWGFFSLFFLMLEREECPNFINLKYVLALNFLLPMDAPHPAEKKEWRRKHRMEVGYRELGLGGGGRWKSYCPPVHYKNQLRVFAFLCGSSLLWIGGGKNLMFIIILMKINTYSIVTFWHHFPPHHSFQDKKQWRTICKKCHTAAWRRGSSFTAVLHSAYETGFLLSWNAATLHCKACRAFRHRD